MTKRNLWGLASESPGVDPCVQSTPTAGVDPETLALAQCGDPAACRLLVRAHQRAVHALVWRMLHPVGREGLAEDLTQEAFLRAFRALPRFDPAGSASLRTWLLTIATRAAVDELRRQRPRLIALDEAPALGGGLRPDEGHERRRLATRIRSATAALGPEVRATFVLRAYHELRYAEIAAALGVDLGTVKSRLHRARIALATALGGDQGGSR